MCPLDSTMNLSMSKFLAERENAWTSLTTSWWPLPDKVGGSNQGYAWCEAPWGGTHHPSSAWCAPPFRGRPLGCTWARRCQWWATLPPLPPEWHQWQLAGDHCGSALVVRSALQVWLARRRSPRECCEDGVLWMRILRSDTTRLVNVTVKVHVGSPCSHKKELS